MVDWKEYRIEETRIFHSFRGEECIDLWLDGYVDYLGELGFGIYKCARISFVNRHPCGSFQVGDYVEVDLDCTRTQPMNIALQNINAIRKIVSSTALVPSSSGGLTISTTPSSAAEVARTVTQTVLDHADRTGGIPQIEIGTDKTSIRYYPPRK